MRIRLSAILIRVAAFLVAGILCAFGARATVAIVEDLSVSFVQASLIENDHSWTSVIGDGLQVIIEGEAPSEAARFRAISVAGGIVDASRVIDNMSVADSAIITAPSFAIEMLRNDSGISLIGLIPSETDQDALASRINEASDGAPVSNFLEAADYPAPDTWRAALNFAVRALGQLPRSKISVTADRVTINAISDSIEQKRSLETSLTRAAPDEIHVALTITAPRPVISPYVTRFVIDAEGVRFDSCTADTEQSATAIVAAAVEAGLEGKTDCTLALGVPSKTWTDAVVLSIKAVKDLGEGTVTISDADVSLVAVEGTDQALFDQVVGDLDNALPDLFALTSSLPVSLTVADTDAAGPPRFTATLSPEGKAQLRGKVGDEMMAGIVENFAVAEFGADDVTMGTNVVQGLPMSWSMRVLAGIEALALLDNGMVVVLPDTVTLQGNTGNANASAEISRLLIAKLGSDATFDVQVTYVEALDPIAALPTPEECVAAVMAATAGRKILFDPGSASITADTQAVVDDIAEALRDCVDAPIEIAGYTDSQGREEMNLSLSKDRAEAVLSALRARRVPTGGFTATGYGEADPIADNATEEGREANRRIEFRLLTAEPAEAAGTAATDAAAAAGDAPADTTAEAAADATDAAADPLAEPTDETAPQD